MKIISENTALESLEKIKNDYRSRIANNYETKAKDCLTCETRGACCIDEHFVNVHISRLEAVAIRQEIKKFAPEKQREINLRISSTIEKYKLTDTPNSFEKTFACPLFEKETGCLVHSVKPVPCIQHACYERLEDLPPDELQTQAEKIIARLNEKTYGKNSVWLALPVWLNSLKCGEPE